MNKLIAYLITLLGVIGIALSLTFVQKMLGLAKPLFSNTILLIAGLIIFVIGIIFIKKSTVPEQPAEVPIYQGQSIVGYRKVN